MHAVKSFNQFDTTCFLYCDASYFRGQDSRLQHNVVGCFKAQSDLTQFPSKLSAMLTTMPDSLGFMVKKWSDQNEAMELIEWDGLIVLELYGFRQV